jgi:hypothetical protein
MENLSILCGGALIAAGAAAALLGSGIATAAPDVVGQTYADATTAIEEDGSTAIVAVRTGGKLPQDECIVTNAWDASYVRPIAEDVYFGPAEGEVMLALNCAGGFATATNPGASLASPMGREAKAAADEAAAAEEQELLEVSTPDE